MTQTTATSLTLGLVLCLAGCSKAPDEGITGGSASATVSNPGTAGSGGADDGTGGGTSNGGSNGTASADGMNTTAADSEGGGVKYDVFSDIDAGPGSGGPGSCRPSEIYGAAGGFPNFSDPAYDEFKDRTVAIVTHNQQAPQTHVMTILDISGDPPPPNTNYLAPKYWRPEWTEADLGKIFGLTLDSDGNIYVAATTVYGANPTPDKIRRIDGITGQITDFVTLPNNGPAFGNLNYDCVSETIYVSNHEDGRIYQIDMNGDVVSTYHHGTGDVTLGLPNTPGEPDGQFAPLGDRVWAVQSHAGRLYYSVWWEHSQSINQEFENEIWSVEYVDGDGVPNPATAVKEFDVPVNSGVTSVPVSDLSFAHDGWMLIAQRTMNGDMNTGAHQSTTYDYNFIDGAWVSQGTNYVVGELLPYSAAGGVDHDFDPGGYVWMTGDALDFNSPTVVYGLQGTPYGGGGVETSTIIDLDEEIISQDKTIYGDVELPIPGDASPVPPPG